MSHAVRLRLASALATAPLLTAGLVGVAGPSASAVPVERPAERVATAKPKVGTYEGTFGPKNSRTYFSLDVEKRKGRLVISDAVALYYCSGSPEVVYSTFGKASVRKGRFTKDSVLSINGAFRSRTKVAGRANPAPGILGCEGRPKPFTARYVGPAVDRTGTYQGVDATGAPVSFEVEGAGRVVDGLDITRKLQCGTLTYNSLFRFGRSGITHAGAAGSSLVTVDSATAFTYNVAFDAAGGVSGTYQVTGAGCDTGPVAFTAAPTP